MISRGVEISIAGGVVAMVRARRGCTHDMPYIIRVRGIDDRLEL